MVRRTCGIHLNIVEPCALCGRLLQEIREGAHTTGMRGSLSGLPVQSKGGGNRGRRGGSPWGLSRAVPGKKP